MSRLRVAIIGLGMAVGPHARSLLDLADRVEVAAAYSPSPQRRAAFSETYGLPVVDDIDTIFADRSIAAVLVLTPPNTHLDLVRSAAASGKHVLVEKPLEVTLEKAEALVATMRTAGLQLGVVLQHRFRPVSIALDGWIREGRLGDIIGASARVNNWRPQSYYDQPGRGTRARDGGGVLLTQAIHALDLLVALAGVPIQVAGRAAKTPIHDMETEDLAAGVVTFANGALGSISATTAAYPGYPDAIDIIATRGTARLEGGTVSAQLHDGTTLTASDGADGHGGGSDPMAFSHGPHRALIRDFIEAVENGVESKISGREALKVHRLIDALLRSAEAGKPLPIGDNCE